MNELPTWKAPACSKRLGTDRVRPSKDAVFFSGCPQGALKESNKQKRCKGGQLQQSQVFQNPYPLPGPQLEPPPVKFLEGPFFFCLPGT
jgi:hypothetical protein